ARSAARACAPRLGRPRPGYNWACRPGDREPFRGSRKVRTPKGRTLGKPQAAKADGKWHRKETAGSDSPETLKVRVKRWGKSPPAPWRHGGSPNPVRCKAKQVPTTWPAEEPGTPLERPGNRPPRWMVTLDRIRLIGLLRNPRANGGSIFFGIARCRSKLVFGEGEIDEMSL